MPSRRGAAEQVGRGAAAARRRPSADEAELLAQLQVIEEVLAQSQPPGFAANLLSTLAQRDFAGPALVGLLSQVEGGVEASEHIHALIVLGSTALVAGLMCAVFQPVAIREQQQWCVPSRRE